MAARIPRWGASAESAFEEGSVVSFKNRQAGVEQLALGDDDNVEPFGDLVTTENLSYQTFSAIPHNRAAQFLCRRDAQPPGVQVVGQHEHRAVPAMQASALFVNTLKIGAATNPLVALKAGHMAWPGLFAADRQAFAALRTTPFEYQAAIFGAHAHAKTVGFGAVSPIRLERANSLGHSGFSFGLKTNLVW